MKALTIEWLNKCRCGNKSHMVKTARGNESALWDDDAVKCNSCGRGGVIEVYEGQARVLWETDEEMAEGKPMSTITKEFTKEQLIEKLQHRVAVTANYPDVEEAQLDAAIFKIALASLEAEPAIHRWRRVTVEPYGPYPWHYGNFIGFSKPVEGIEDEYYYPAPPAPVSVPDEDLLHMAASAIEDLLSSKDRSGAGVWADVPARLRRAAMLQGAAGNSPVIPDWQTKAEKLAELHGSSFVVFRNGGHPQCADPSKVIISFTDEGLGHGAAAPQQEVK